MQLTNEQEAFEKCWAHTPLRAAARHLFYIAIHQVSLLSHAACASMSTTSTTTTTTTTRDRGDRYGPRAQLNMKVMKNAGSMLGHWADKVKSDRWLSFLHSSWIVLSHPSEVKRLSLPHWMVTHQDGIMQVVNHVTTNYTNHALHLSS